MAGIIGKKLGMTQIFDDTGAALPVTVVEAGPCPVLQVRGEDGQPEPRTVQLGFGAKREKHSTLAERGHAAKAGLDRAPVVLREFRLGAGDEAPETGSEVTVSLFESGERVKVTGTSKGRGFQGVVKRHGFAGGKASHGAHRVHRAAGSIGPGTNPSRVIKGKKMPGRMGGVRRTVRNSRVAKIDADRNLLYLSGAVPGAVNGFVFITKQ
ncbi:MAG: 50S ribosomal protein L3 [Longimicrobiaceae bacterium]